MKLDEVRGGVAENIRLVPTETSLQLKQGAIAEVDFVRRDSETLMRSGTLTFAVEGATSADELRLQELVLSNQPHLAAILRIDSNSEILVQFRRFPTELQILESFEIGVDEQILDKLRTTFRIGGSLELICNWLEQSLLIEHPSKRTTGAKRFIMCGTHVGGNETFRIVGDSIAADIRRVDNRLRIERIVRGGRLTNTRLVLAHAHVTFVDATLAAELNGAARTSLSAAVANATSYLRYWQTYQQIEREQLQRRAEAIGFFAYERVERRSNGAWRFLLTPGAADELLMRIGKVGHASSLELEAGEQLPRLGKAEQAPPDAYRQTAKQRRLQGPIANYSVAEDFAEILPDDEDDGATTPPSKGYLYLATSGDETRIERRAKAEEALRTGICPMPQLGLLLEGRPAPAARRSRISTRSPKLKAVLRDSFGPSGPTERQREAIEIALNTPDICLIQGPPGTGKTKVITAIEQCLAILADDGVEPSHRILVSAAQHDAVENVAARTEVFGLPATKIGKKRNSGEATLDVARVFAEERVAQLRAKQVVRTDAERLTNARRLVIAARLSTSTTLEQALQIRQIVRELETLLEPSVRDNLLRHADQLTAPTSSGEPEELQQAMRAARGIRVDEATFSDDGPLRANIALARLERWLDADAKSFLSKCVSVEQGDAPSWIEQGAALRTALIDRLSQSDVVAQPQSNVETQKLLLDLLDRVHRKISSGALGADAAIAAYIDDLDSDPDAVREALEYYTVVLAATLQQAAGKQMMRVTGIDAGTPTFESVIVDEAARANPLDLFIPLSMAKRRVVLVGDHRQLPHLLEPDVESQMERSVEEGTLLQETLDAVSESLFQRLWKLLRVMQQQDAIPRTVTLDAQYRMHPILGAFVSREFYEIHEDGAISSPRPAEDFEHTLPGYDKDGRPVVAAWLDVPAHLGSERSGSSKSRAVEARAIAEEVSRLIDHDPRLTFGIISFYSAQVEELFKALGKVGLAERPAHDRPWRICDQWATTLNGQGRVVERLRVGTVDAFQGKEFDVVFLSAVRSNKLRGATERDRRSKFGHLMLENRLCVAMSRQQRLLVTVGDLSFVRADDAREPLRSLYAFSDLCRGPLGLVR